MAENKCAKQGRNAEYCKVYRARGRRERNKLLRAIRTLRRQGMNGTVAKMIAGMRRNGHETAWRDAKSAYLSATDTKAAHRHIAEIEKATA